MSKSLFALCLAALALTTTARAEGPPAAPQAPALPPPVALGGECRLLVACPWSGPLAAHFRLGGFVWLGQDGDPRPISVVPSAALSVSLWRWAEAGAMFSARGGAAADHSSALLQLPITLWARLSPQIGVSGGLQVAAEVRTAIGRAPFDAGGTVYADSQSYALSVGYRKDRVEAFVTGAYEEAGARSYHGLAAGGGLYVLALRSLGLQLGAEALGRFGGEGGAAAPSWTAAAVVRFVDEHGVSGTLGSGAGGGPGMPGRMPLAFFFGMSFGPDYRPHPPAPGYESLREAIEGWLTERWRNRPRYGLPLLPGFGPTYGFGYGSTTGRALKRLAAPAAPPPAYCTRLSGLSARAVTAQALRSCVDASLWPGGAPGAGPAAPAAPAPPPPPGIAGGAPRPPPRGPGAMPRSGLRTGRGTGHEDPDTRAGEARAGAPLPGFPPPGARPAPRGPRPPAGEIPSIGPPVYGQAPQAAPRPAAEPLPPGTRPESVPPFLRPAPAQQRGVADHGLAPLAPASPRPLPPTPAPQPAERPGVAEHAAPRGGQDPRVLAAAVSGSQRHADRPGQLPPQLRETYPETELRFNKPGVKGPDVEVVGGKHPSEYENSNWPPGVRFGDFKPDTPGGRKTFKADQQHKWSEPVYMLPYDPVTGRLK